MQTRAPHRPEPINTWLDRGGGMDALPTSAREHFAQWALVEIPTCCLKRSPGEGRLLGDGERGEEIISRSSSSAPEDHDSDGVSSPPRPHGRSGSAPELPPLLPYTLPFIIGTVGLPPRHMLGQSDPRVGRYAHTQDPVHKHNRH
jgi:hypothetical protein